MFASIPPSDSAATAALHLATPRGADNVLSSALAPSSATTIGMFSPVSTGLESARDLGPFTATVDSDDATRITEINRGIPSGRVKEAHQESTGSWFFLSDTLASRRANPGLYTQNHARLPRDEDAESLLQYFRQSQECGGEDF